MAVAVADTKDEAANGHSEGRTALIIGALGVVFGDIGTSPIYTISTVFNPDDPHPVPLNHEAVYGVVSLLFWSVMAIVTLTYVTLVMRADNHGEGGVMALITLVKKWGARSGGKTRVLAAMGVFGAALFFGDSMITPAISVLSAVEGVKTLDPGFADWVVPVTAVIIVALFMVQKKGTDTVGKFFGPVMIVWFLTLAALGIKGIMGHPVILKALSPTYALGYLGNHFHLAFFALAAIVLSVTGAEALYADMGHFGRRAITFGWLGLVLPSLVLCYLGQGALILGDQSTVSAPFFLLSPDWARIPLILLTVVATIIASQAVITGAYSVASQAAQLGYLPRLRIVYTSESTMGQIYVPWINWMLMVSVLTLVFAFRSSAALAFAYGMAVTATILITTALFGFLAYKRWKTPLWLVLLVGIPLLSIDVLFVAVNVTKLVHGAWLPLLIGITAFTIMQTWQKGRIIATAAREAEEGPLQQFIDELHTWTPSLTRTPGTAVYLNRGLESAPIAMRETVEHFHVLHEQVVIMTILTESVPSIRDSERLSVDSLGFENDGIIRVTVRYGYMENPNVPRVLRMLDPALTEGRVAADDVSYFLSKIELKKGDQPTMAAWRKRLFIASAHVSSDAADYFRLPRSHTVTIGSQIEV
ncbi:potassium transporter Kup [Smaragdicoccus niigatensis]|uniref:potassium transporter Kup n=1 Tax=Smaragdicoccus niigatensis TaxID=359359 RepID=UPI0003738465|nr:potassium transporter Kup [Smaragdicoccus niigatensis]